MRRDWRAAREKLEAEGHCRFCGTTHGLTCAHIIPRSRIGAMGGAEDSRNIIPLCQRDHTLQHAGRLELLPLMTLEEQSYAAWLVGIAEAYRRTTNRELAA